MNDTASSMAILWSHAESDEIELELGRCADGHKRLPRELEGNEVAITRRRAG